MRRAGPPVDTLWCPRTRPPTMGQIVNIFSKAGQLEENLYYTTVKTEVDIARPETASGLGQ